MRIVLAVALALSAAEPQTPEPAGSAPRVVDVLAFDSGGRPIDTLIPADFSVLEQGVPQTIASARFVRDDIRLFGIFLDEFHTTPDAATRVRDALVRFVKTDLGPRDRIGVFRPLDSLLAVTLSDRDAAANAIQTFEGRQGDFTPRTSFERNFIAGAPSRILAARNQITVSALNALATHLGASGAGRKTLLVVSGGIPTQPRTRGDEPLPTLDTVVRAANRAQVSIYPVEVGGGGDHESDLAARQALRDLATETAGRPISPSANLALALKGVLADSAGYYAITLAPNAERADDRIHPVDISVARGGVALRARRGYWAAEPGRTLSRAGDRLRSASREAELPRRTSPLIRPWFGLARGSDGTTRVSFVWEPAPRVPGERSPARLPARVALNVSRADSGAQVFDGVVLPASGGQRGPTPQDARAVFELPPGRLRVQMSIEDAASQQLDTDVRDLVVGGFSGPLTLGTARVLRARNAREFRALAGNAEATPVAVRQFSRAERLIVRVPVYASGARPTVAARLLSRFGLVMRTLEVREAPGSEDYQLDLPLAGLASGDYAIEFTAHNEDGDVKDTLVIRVTP